jgi:hypothetical protein
VEAGRARLHSSPTFENGLARLVAHVGGSVTLPESLTCDVTTEDRKILRISSGLERRILWVAVDLVGDLDALAAEPPSPGDTPTTPQ